MLPRPARVLAVAFAFALAGGGCTCGSGDRGRPPSPLSPPADAPASSSSAAAPRCSDTPPRPEIAPGLFVERVLAARPPPIDAGDRCLTLVRVDPSRYRLRLLTAFADGGVRPVPEWAARFHLTGVINASMFDGDNRSTGLLVSEGAANNDTDQSQFGGYLAFDPTSPGAPPVAFFGRSCPGFDLAAIRRSYRSLVQNYRLLDCDGHAILWQDRKAYSAAAVGMDRAGRVVFLHSRTPWTMTDLAAMIADPALGMKAALFVEGGPEASLYVKAGGTEVRAIGSYETGFQEDDRNQRFWDLPNVLGFLPR